MCNDLEDTNHSRGWWYRDTLHTLQGPYGKDQIQAWSRSGYFPPNTPVRQGDKGKWWTFGDVDWETGEIKLLQKTQPVGIDERITALRREQSIPSINTVDEVSSRGDTHMQQLLSPHGSLHDTDEDDDNNNNSVFARIEALKQLSKPPEMEENEATLRKCVHYEGKPLNDHGDNDEIAVFQLSHHLLEVDGGVDVGKIDNRGKEDKVSVISSNAAPTEIADFFVEGSNISVPNTGGGDDTAPSHAGFLADKGEPIEYTIDETALYPVGEELVYPVGEELVYPVGEDLVYPVGEDLVYPVGEELVYPVGDPVGEGLEYPVNFDSAIIDKHAASTVNVYPVDIACPATGAYIENSKRDDRIRDHDGGYDVGKTLVPPTKENLLVVAGLIPSHVQKTRKSRTTPKINVTSTQKLPPRAEGGKEGSKSAVYDYEKFMVEIASLK